MLVDIRLFGLLKKFGKDGVLSLEIPPSSTQAQVKALIKQTLSSTYPGTFHDALVERAALASGTHILNNDEIVCDNGNLALLPPVCGG